MYKIYKVYYKFELILWHTDLSARDRKESGMGLLNHNAVSKNARKYSQMLRQDKMTH